MKNDRPFVAAASRAARQDDDEVGGVAVEDEALGAVEPIGRRPNGVAVVATPAASVPPSSSEKARVAVVVPSAMAGQQGALLLFGAGIQDGGGGQHGREEGRAEQAAAHLLEHDGELGIAEAPAAIGLGDMDAR